MLSRNVVSRFVATGVLLLFAVMTLGAVSGWAQDSDAGLVSAGPAPEFSLQRAAKTDRALSEFKGRYIVLEWVDFTCPATLESYEQQYVQKLQSLLREKGVVWFSVCSTPENSPGYLTGDSLRVFLGKIQSTASDFLLDPDGQTARAYGVTVAPTVVMIDPDGMIVYAGAFDEPSVGSNGYDRKPEDCTFYKAASRVLMRRQVTSPAPSPVGCQLRPSGTFGSTEPGK